MVAAESAAVELLTTARKTAADLLAIAKRIAADRLASAHRFEAMFRDHRAVMLLIDPETGLIVDANPAATAFYGFAADELIAMPITQINVMSADVVAHQIHQAKSRQQSHFTFPHRLADGEIRRVDVVSSPIHDGRPLLFSIITDAEERVLAEEELARVSQYSRSLIEASLDPLVTINADGVITDVNVATKTVTGRDRSALIGSDFATNFTSPDLARAGYQKAFTEGFITNYALAIRHTSGAVTDVLYNATVYRDTKGEIAGVFAAARDVTDRKRVERALVQQTQRLELVLSASGLGLWDWDLITRQTVFDERYSQMLGFHLADLEPTTIETWQGLTHPDDLARVRQAIDDHQAGLTPDYNTEYRMRHRDGNWVWIHSRGKVVEWTSDGQPLRMTGTHADISAERAADDRLAAAEEESRLAFDRSRVATCLVANDGRITRANSAFCELLGRSEAEMLSLNFLDVTHPDDVAVGDSVLRELWGGHRPTVRLTKRYVTGGNHAIWGDVTVSAVLNEDGALRHRIAQIIDVSAEHNLRESLQDTQRIAHIGSWTLDLATQHVTWSQDLYTMQGLDPQVTPPDFPEHSRLFTAASWQELSSALAVTQATGEPYELKLEMARADGSHGWMLARGEAVRDANGDIVGLQGVAMDITANKLAADALLVQATHDPLTGLANRAALSPTTDQTIAADASSGLLTAVLMLDLDHFKEVNDVRGHAAGDDLLVAVARRIENAVQTGDLIARLGGDEFVVVMAGLSNTADALRVADRLVRAFHDPFLIHNNEVSITASVGVAISSDGSGVGTLLREADLALYTAKAQGRDRVECFTAQ